jgi:hypothetical protein
MQPEVIELEAELLKLNTLVGQRRAQLARLQANGRFCLTP